ncbi:winged helix-turn-helix transcriptional regulator [Candidatus Poribacteria bacterium]|nr:winged helix-turn-helix transcriptional regulator [Candidatus Poribacteria bacterium]
MRSIFDPAAQHSDVDSKVVAALERLSEAFRILLWMENRETRLSPIQMQFLVHCLYQPAENRTVGSLAEYFGLTPATVSDAVRVLEAKGYVGRQQDALDRRVVHLYLTADGRTVAQRVSGWAEPMRKALADISQDQKLVAMEVLMGMIANLFHSGVISVANMCLLCANLAANASGDEDAPYWCSLRDQPVHASDLRLNCASHRSLYGGFG